MKGLLYLVALCSFSAIGQDYDSLVVYHEPFCAPVEEPTVSEEKLTESSITKKYKVTDAKIIKKTVSYVDKLKETKVVEDAEVFNLVCYAYSGGKKTRLFSLMRFKRLRTDKGDFKYDIKFLNTLFKTERTCYY